MRAKGQRLSKAPMLYLLRHAKAGNRYDALEDDRERSLTQKGLVQAQSIATHLTPKGITEIISSPYRRCIETVRPLSILSGVEITDDSVLGEEATIDGLRAIVTRCLEAAPNQQTTASTVICTHGNVVPAIIDILGLYSNDTIRCAKGSLYEIDLADRILSYIEF